MLREIVQTVLSTEGEVNVSLVYLFGSRAKVLAKDSPSPGKDVGPLSDYDFGIVTPFSPKRKTAVSRPQLFRLQSKLARQLESEVDVVLLNGAPIELQYNVIATGLVLFEESIAARVEYESWVLSRYGDYLPVLRRQREDIIQGGSDETRVQRYREALGKTEQLLEQTRTAK